MVLRVNATVLRFIADYFVSLVQLGMVRNTSVSRRRLWTR
jgi:hypothetical protein